MNSRFIERLAKSRPLYPEERYLKASLSDYRKTLKKLAGKNLTKKLTKKIKRKTMKKSIRRSARAKGK